MFTINKRKITLISLFIAVSVHFIFFSILSIQKFNNFDPKCLEIGDCIYRIQNVIKEIKLNPLFLLGNKAEPFCFFYFPYNIIFILFQTILPFPKALIFYNVFFTSFAAIPIYLIAKLKFEGNLLPLALAISYLLHPVVNSIAIYGFSINTTAIPSLLFAFYYLEKGMLKRSLIFVVLSIAIRTPIAAITCLWGLSLILSKKNKRFGKTIFLFSIFWIVVSFAIFYFWVKLSGLTVPMEIIHLEKYGNNFSQAFRTIIINPNLVIKHFFNENNLILILLFLPLGFSPLFYPFFLIPIFPALGFIIIHNAKTGAIIPIIAVIYIAAIYGVKRIMFELRNKLSKIRKKIIQRLAINIETFAAVIILLIGFFSSYYLSDYFLFDANLGPLPFSKNFDINYYKIKPRSITGHKIYKLIPQDSSCLTLPSLFNYLSCQKKLGSFSELINNSSEWEYIFLDMQQMDRRLSTQLKDVLQKDNYGTIVYQEDWLLLKRGYGIYLNKEVISDIIKLR